MQWFKNFSDNYRGRSVLSFHRNFGNTGIAWYYLFTEICVEKLGKPLNGKKHENDEATFSFDKAFITSSLRGNAVKIASWLRHGEVLGLWTFTETEHEFTVNYPILLNLLHNDLLKSSRKPVLVKSESSLDKDKDKDKDNNKGLEFVDDGKLVEKKNSVQNFDARFQEPFKEMIEILKPIELDGIGRKNPKLLLEIFQSDPNNLQKFLHDVVTTAQEKKIPETKWSGYCAQALRSRLGVP